MESKDKTKRVTETWKKKKQGGVGWNNVKKHQTDT